MEQLRHRLTDVSPKGQRRSVDQNTLKRVRSSRTCPASLDTLKVSVPPAVKLAPASADLDDFVACYFGTPRQETRPTTESASVGRVSPPGGNRHDRKESERFRSFTYEELTKRDKRSIALSNMPGFPRHARNLGASRRKAGLPASANLDIFWLKDESLEDSANLPAPDVLAASIDSLVPTRSPSGLPVHVVHSHELRCRRPRSRPGPIRRNRR